MRSISIEDSESLPVALEVLRSGGVIVYPTETAYGLGADTTNSQAVEKIIAIKARDEGNPIPIIVADKEQALRYVSFSEKAQKLAENFWPGPLTLGLPTTDPALAHILRGEISIGVRVSGLDWCRALARNLERPITSTSANTAGTPPEYSTEGVRNSLKEQADMVDLWIDGGILAGGPVSTVVRIVEGFEIRREGAISREDIEKVLR